MYNEYRPRNFDRYSDSLLQLVNAFEPRIFKGKKKPRLASEPFNPLKLNNLKKWTYDLKNSGWRRSLSCLLFCIHCHFCCYWR